MPARPPGPRCPAERIQAILGDRYAAQVTRRLNHTGADQLSYVVATDPDPLWVKVAAEPEDNPSLDRWADVADRLVERCLAVPVLERFEVDGRTALAFPFLDGVAGTPWSLRPHLDELTSALDRLHADQEIAVRLGEATTARASFAGLWIRRLTEDLALVDGQVENATWDEMAAELATLERLIDDPAFDATTSAPTHRDPWHENVLVGPDRIWLLDWEDLAVGDPVVDHAILRVDLLGPDAPAPKGVDVDRYAVAVRAVLLDAVIDTAADIVEQPGTDVARRKDRAWRAALDSYRSRYRDRSRG